MTKPKTITGLTPLKLILIMGFVAGSLGVGFAFVDYYLSTGKGLEGYS